MHRVIVVGSPRAEGRSAHLADELFNACIEECPEDGVSIVSVASTDVRPCTGCGACATLAAEPLFTFEEGDPLTPNADVLASDAPLHACVIDDDMNEVRKHLDAADELIVVSPVYFSGAPAQMKALLDRMQPYFESNLRRLPHTRPMVLHVVGEGGDPYGFDALVSEMRSAFSVAGFRLELVLDWVGKIDASGEIVAEADEYPVLAPEGFSEPVVEKECGSAEPDDACAPVIDDVCAEAGGDPEDDWPDSLASARTATGRSKLSLADAEPRKRPSARSEAEDETASGAHPRKRRGGKNQQKKGPKPNSRQSNGRLGGKRDGRRRG